MKTILILSLLGILASCSSLRDSGCKSKESCSKSKCEKEKRNHVREFHHSDRLR